jgi:hypothetical protein
MRTEEQRAWNGDLISNPAQYRYGSADEYGRLAKIESTVELNEKEIAAIEESIHRYGARFAIVRQTPKDPTHLDVEFRSARPFERIRRITGYLTGSLETWNSAKQSEERDRVKHGFPHPEEEINNHIRED